MWYCIKKFDYLPYQEFDTKEKQVCKGILLPVRIKKEI